MLTALAIKLRWYAEVLSSSSQNWKTYPTISAKCSIQIKINLSSRFDMIWCSPEARGRNTTRTTTQEQSSRLNCAMFQLCVTVCGHARCLWAKFPHSPILHYAYSLLLKKTIAQTKDYLWDYPLCFQEVEFFLSLYSNLRKVRK